MQNQSRCLFKATHMQCLTFTLPDPVWHGTMDCYSRNHLVTNCPFFYMQCLLVTDALLLLAELPES
jgi:hypothetical protein